MEDIDYVVNDLLRPVMVGPSIRFISIEHVPLYRSALSRLEPDGYPAIFTDLAKVESKSQLFEVVSTAAAAPQAITNWGAFGDCMIRPPRWPNVKGRFFYFENSLRFWQTNTLLAGSLTEELQLAVNFWASRGMVAKAIYEFC